MTKFILGKRQKRNPFIRFKEHFDDAFGRNLQRPLPAEIRKFGIENFIFQVVEKDIPLEELDDKERLYISQYNFSIKGYNISNGGQDILSHSKISENDARDIISYIREGKRSFKKIAEMYGINESSVSDINNGDTWRFTDETYPIANRDRRHSFKEEEILEIYKLLREGVSMRQIGKRFGVSNVAISNINKGSFYKHEDETYPIREIPESWNGIPDEKLINTVKYLEDTSLRYSAISKIIDVPVTTIANINYGKSHVNKLKSLGVTNFPIRKVK